VTAFALASYADNLGCETAGTGEEGVMAKAKKKQTPTLKRAQAQAERMLKRATREAGKLVRDAEKAVRGLERRGEKLLGGIEAQAAKAVTPALRKSFASRNEVDELKRRIAELEKKLSAAAQPAALFRQASEA
jgi:hypothetical protein